MQTIQCLFINCLLLLLKTTPHNYIQQMVEEYKQEKFDDKFLVDYEKYLVDGDGKVTPYEETYPQQVSSHNYQENNANNEKENVEVENESVDNQKRNSDNEKINEDNNKKNGNKKLNKDNDKTKVDVSDIIVENTESRNVDNVEGELPVEVEVEVLSEEQVKG